MEKYVELTAKSNTWFKAFTQVYEYNAPFEKQQLVTLADWEEALKDGMICVRGIRVCESVYELCKVGEEYVDGECCTCDEFDAKIV